LLLTCEDFEESSFIERLEGAEVVGLGLEVVGVRRDINDFPENVQLFFRYFDRFLK
jgi:hypothetical protein